MIGDIAFVMSLGVMLVANLYYGPRVQANKIAMQWSFGGKPTWYATKTAGMWGPLALAVLVRLLIWAVQTYTPDKVYGVDIGLTMFAVIIAIVHVVTLKVATR